MDIVINAQIEGMPDGNRPVSTEGNFYHNILSCLGYPDDAPPVADLLRSYHGLKGQWLIASPIHWQATHNDAMIVASGPDLQLSEQESLLWFAAFKEFVAPDNINLHYHDAYTWLLQCEDKPQIAAKPVHFLGNQSLMPELKALDETLFWLRFLTENQMFFSAHPLNKTRTELYPINGLWVWGKGQLHERVQKPLICSTDSLVKLGKILSTSVNLYQPTQPCDKNSMLLFDKLQQHDLHGLQTQVQKNTVYWYWNNLAYLSKPKSWLARFMERT